jgi:hypothetical protein
MSKSFALFTAGLFALGTFACGDDSGASSAGGSNAGGSNAGGSNAGGSNAGGSNAGGSNAGGSSAGGSSAGGSNAGGSNAGGFGSGANGAGVLDGYWVWEDRVAGNESLGFAHLNGQALMRMAFGNNNTCHYIWNETTGSDFHTPCTYTILGDMVTYTATADPDQTAAGYSCTHPDWTSWNDRPAVQYGKYKFVGDRLWLGVNAYWGFGGDALGVSQNGSCKRFGYWESEAQADYGGQGDLETWIVYKPVTKQEWESAGFGSCAACATYPAAVVCE